MSTKTKEALADVEWHSPNTHVFFMVQVLGVAWLIWWLITRWFNTGSPLDINLLITGAMVSGRYSIGMWFVTVWRHRYFAHRTFKINPMWSWIESLAAIICSADAQRGVLKWTDDHRWHHKHSDTPKDKHSCKQRGILWCHILWVVKKSDKPADLSRIPDLARSKALVWIENRQWIGIIVGGFIFSMIGTSLSIGGYESPLHNFIFSLCAHFLATTLLWHGTFLINSAMHLIGKQDFNTGDESRNSLLLAILTFGEGWHNNHHWDFPSLELAKRLAGSIKRKTSELYWQGKTTFQRCFDWSGISIWCLIKLRVFQSL